MSIYLALFLIRNLFKEVTEPKIEIPDQGFIEVIAEMHPMSSSKFKPGSHEDTSAVVTQFIHEVLNRSSFVDLRELCLKEGKVSVGF